MFARSHLSIARAQLLQVRARQMRFSPTHSEELLWRGLAGSKTGLPFRRQHVFAHWIVDFASPKARLVVEVDGPYHEDRPRPDATRDRSLRHLGWYVLHFSDSDVVHDTDQVIERIRLCGELRSP